MEIINKENLRKVLLTKIKGAGTLSYYTIVDELHGGWIDAIQEELKAMVEDGLIVEPLTREYRKV